MTDYQNIAGAVGMQRARFLESYAVKPNRVGLPVNMRDGDNLPVEIMGMEVRWLDWPDATVTVWREWEGSK